MYVYHQNDQSVKKIWIEISIRKKKLNKFWAVGWQMGKVIVLPFQCILFQYQVIMILQMGNVLSSLSSLHLLLPSSCLIISSCSFWRDLFLSFASRFLASVCWTLKSRENSETVLQTWCTLTWNFEWMITLMMLLCKSNTKPKENLVVVEMLWNSEPGQECVESFHYPATHLIELNNDWIKLNLSCSKFDLYCGNTKLFLSHKTLGNEWNLV